MPGYHPHSAALAISLGGLALGAALAMATPTQMRMAPDPPWRNAHATATARAIASEDAGAPLFSGDTYEMLPARAMMHQAYAEPALPPSQARYDDDGAWAQPDLDAPDLDVAVGVAVEPELLGDVVPADVAEEDRADAPWAEEVSDDIAPVDG